MNQPNHSGFLSAKEAIEELGITEGTFYSYIRKGTLHKHTPPGKKYSLYSRQEVKHLADELKGFISPSKEQHKVAIVSRGTVEDMPETGTLIEAIFGTYPNLERWSKWIEKNPEIFYLMRHEDKVVGCAFIMPLAKQRIDDILAHEITPPIEAKEIGLYTPGETVHLYIRTVGIDPTVSHEQKRVWGARIVTRLIRLIEDLGKRGIYIQTITSRSETKDGINLLRHFGFTEIETVTSSRNFVIDVKQSGIPFIMKYKRALNQASEWI